MPVDQIDGGQQIQNIEAAKSGTSPELTGGQGFSFEDAVSSVTVQRHHI